MIFLLIPFPILVKEVKLFAEFLNPSSTWNDETICWYFIKFIDNSKRMKSWQILSTHLIYLRPDGD